MSEWNEQHIEGKNHANNSIFRRQPLTAYRGCARPASPAAADNKHNKSGNARVPSYFAYPRGRNLAQHYAQPLAGIGNLAAFNSSPGSVSPRASMSVLYQQPGDPEAGRAGMSVAASLHCEIGLEIRQAESRRRPPGHPQVQLRPAI